MSSKIKLFVSALEISSNVHLRFLIKGLESRIDIELYGVFDKDISTNSPIYSPKDFSIMGFVDVFYKIRFLSIALKNMSKLALSCDKILLLDSSSFHIPLAKKIKKQNKEKEIIYYILPQIWAWKPWRAKVIEEYFDILAGILPFEIEYYKSKAIFVGHPLLDEIKEFKNEVIDSNIITFMPGSRISEINRIFPIFREVKDRLKNLDSTLLFNLVVPKVFKDSNLIEIYKNLDDFNIVFDSHQSLYKSKFAFICSGTATLECAIIGTPFVLGYKAKKIDALIVKNFLNIKYVGLANILYQKINPDSIFHDEFLQNELNADNLIDSYYSSNDNDFIYKSRQIRDYLKHGSLNKMCDIVLDSK